MRKLLFASAIVLSACASRPAAVAPVTVVVIADEADRVDAARLQTLTEEAIRHTGGSEPRVVTIRYFGYPNRVELPPIHLLRGYQNQLVFAAFTITDRDGRVLHSEWLRLSPSEERQQQFHGSANVIAARVAQVSGS
jgi:hypothetical protein